MDEFMAAAKEFIRIVHAQAAIEFKVSGYTLESQPYTDLMKSSHFKKLRRAYIKAKGEVRVG